MAWIETIATNWTPTVTQSGSVTLTVNYAKYSVSGSQVILIATLAITGSGTAGNSIIVSGIPAAVRPTANTVIGSGMVIDTGTAVYTGVLLAQAADQLVVYAHNASIIGVSPSFALANTDSIYIAGAYLI